MDLTPVTVVGDPVVKSIGSMFRSLAQLVKALPDFQLVLGCLRTRLGALLS
jgi:hypothetical protein